MAKRQVAVVKKNRADRRHTAAASAESAAKSTPPVHPLSLPIGDLGHACSYFEPGEFTRTHELMTDAFTQMLTSGGHPDDVNALIRATMAHTRRRTFDAFEATDQENQQHVAKFIDGDFEIWKQDLLTFWRKNKRIRPAPLEPKSLTDRIRFNLRETLAGYFEEFMGVASPEEQFFLMDVFKDHASRNHPGEQRDAEIFIALAFERQLEDAHCYVRVPSGMIGRVEKYVEALRAVEGQEVA